MLAAEVYTANRKGDLRCWNYAKKRENPKVICRYIHAFSRTQCKKIQSIDTIFCDAVRRAPAPEMVNNDVKCFTRNFQQMLNPDIFFLVG